MARVGAYGPQNVRGRSLLTLVWQVEELKGP